MASGDVARPDDGLEALTDFFVDDGTIGETLTRVSQLACEASQAEMAGLTLLVEGRMTTGVFTDPEAVHIDEEQYRTGDGPCVDAFRTEQIHRIDNTATETRWLPFCRAAREHGISSTLSMPVVARQQSLGALNLYSRAAAHFDDGKVAALQRFTRQAAMILSNARIYWDARNLTDNLHQAMRSRSTIDYAVGILMVHGGRSPEDAFQLLVRASQRENRKLREIAAEIVERAAARELPTL